MTAKDSEAVAIALVDGAWSVGVVNPARIKGFAQGELLRNKPDRATAALLARFGQAMRPVPWVAAGEHPPARTTDRRSHRPASGAARGRQADHQHPLGGQHHGGHSPAAVRWSRPAVHSCGALLAGLSASSLGPAAGRLRGPDAATAIVMRLSFGLADSAAACAEPCIQDDRLFDQRQLSASLGKRRSRPSGVAGERQQYGRAGTPTRKLRHRPSGCRPMHATRAARPGMSPRRR